MAMHQTMHELEARTSTLTGYSKKAKMYLKKLLIDPSMAQGKDIDFPDAKKLWAKISKFEEGYEKFTSENDNERGPEREKFVQEMLEGMRYVISKYSKYKECYEYLIEVRRMEDRLKKLFMNEEEKSQKAAKRTAKTRAIDEEYAGR